MMPQTFLISALAIAALVGVAAAQPVQLESTAVVFAYPHTDPYDRHNLYGFNHAPNVAVMPDGSLLASWFSGAFEGDVHQVILGAKSSDGGRTWEVAEQIVDIPRTSDFDPAFAIKNNKVVLLLAAGRWNRYPWVGERAVENKLVGLDSYRLYVVTSDDSGATWSEPQMTLDRRGFSRGNGIVLRDGKILFPVYDDVGGGKWTTSILRSRDDGMTGQWSGALNAADGKAGGEPAIVELDNGSVLVATRSRDGRVWFAESPDAGDTWGEPYASEFDAATSSHALLRTKSGRVFLAYNACKPPERTALSLREYDQRAKKWSDPFTIVNAPPRAPDAWGSQVSYPSLAEAQDGALILVWTEISLAPTRQTGIIKSARIKL
ncbi:MAG TPA: sialidase family protein [Opitutus sp.]|nr:sialidase family protein [Opitutus sp.]